MNLGHQIRNQSQFCGCSNGFVTLELRTIICLETGLCMQANLDFNVICIKHSELKESIDLGGRDGLPPSAANLPK